MKKLLLTLTLLSLPLSSLAGDFQKGVTAAQNGDFATALQEWIPLAEQGHVAVQFTLRRLG